MKHELILINPWIYDFAAYDLWSKPLGLLTLAGLLRKSGFDIHLIDCLDVHHPGMKKYGSFTPPVRRLFGTGKFWKEKAQKPSALKCIPRTYSRYGITKELFQDALKKTEHPAAILVTSLMTYWYPGVQEVIRISKEIHPGVPVLLGGIYARLCEDHAREFSGADYLASDIGQDNPQDILKIFKRIGIEFPRSNPSGTGHSYPAFDLLRRLDYVCVQTSTGCPYKCDYCASQFLNPRFIKRDPDKITDEILFWHEIHGVEDFAFYDDALLVDSKNHIRIVLEKIAGLGLNFRFHTPNGLHAREISPEIADLLFLSGFRTIRLGLETSDIKQHDSIDKKLSEGEFEKAIENFFRAGFKKEMIGAYVLMGLPGQTPDSVARTLEFAGKLKCNPYLAEYSPLPHTPMWEKALNYSLYDIASEPLYHNSSLLPCWNDEQKKLVPELKRMVREIRQRN